MSLERHEQTKTHVNVEAIGHVDHGKTTLTAAICTTLAKVYGGQAKDLVSVEKRERNLIFALSRVEYDTPKRHYIHADHPAHMNYVKNTIAGAAQMDGAILVVSATDGPMPQTREQILLARQVGVPYIVVFINKCDLVDDEEQLGLIELEVRELLSEYDFPGDELPVIKGSALGALNGQEKWEAKIIELAEALDLQIPEPTRAIDRPFLMPIEDVFLVESWLNTVAARGRIERGILAAGDEVAMVGIKETTVRTCVGVEKGRQSLSEPRQVLDEGRTGENVEVLLLGTQRDEVEQGQVLAAPNSITPRTKFFTAFYMLSSEEGGRSIPFFKGYRPQFYFRTKDINGSFHFPEEVEMVIPGDNTQMMVELDIPIAMDKGLRFEIREGGRTVGVGVVTEIF